MTRPSVGVVGLGRMGGNAAACLVDDGFPVHGYDVAESAREAAASDGVTVADDVPALASAVDVVVTSLPTPEIVADAYLGEDGIVASVDGHLAAVEMSTIDPDTTEQVATAAAEADVDLVDAPVSGGPEDAGAGTLTMLIGGDADVIESAPVAPVVDALSSASYHVGDVGAGHTAKLLNNVMSMGNLLLATEAVSLGAERGLDGAALFEALSNAGGSSNQFEKRIPRVLNRNFEPSFAVSLARKDLGLALDAADGSDHSMPVTALLHQLYTRAVEEGHAEEDAGAVAKLFEYESRIQAEEPVDESFEGY